MKTFLATLTGISLAATLLTPYACVLALASMLAYLTLDLLERWDV